MWVFFFIGQSIFGVNPYNSSGNITNTDWENLISPYWSQNLCFVLYSPFVEWKSDIFTHALACANLSYNTQWTVNIDPPPFVFAKQSITMQCPHFLFTSNFFVTSSSSYHFFSKKVYLTSSTHLFPHQPHPYSPFFNWSFNKIQNIRLFLIAQISVSMDGSKSLCVSVLSMKLSQGTKYWMVPICSALPPHFSLGKCLLMIGESACAVTR